MSPSDYVQWLSDYRQNKEIQGWVDNRAFDLLAVLYEILYQEKVTGGVMEIGVHHGRFFIAINAMSENDRRSVALDVFENQHLNIDGSGHGDAAIFKSHLREFDRHSGRNVDILARDSTTVRASEIPATFKIISIDGGHTAEHTISDINLANELIDDRGFVIIDDITNCHWLGVMDGVTTYLRTRPTLWPVIVGFNKLIMCRMSFAAKYQALVAPRFNDTKFSELCGYKVLGLA